MEVPNHRRVEGERKDADDDEDPREPDDGKASISSAVKSEQENGHGEEREVGPGLGWVNDPRAEIGLAADVVGSKESSPRARAPHGSIVCQSSRL